MRVSISQSPTSMDIQNDYLLNAIKVIRPALIIANRVSTEKKTTEWDGTLIICNFKLKF